MKPTQEQILSALNKLIKESKTELKTERVELGLGDESKKLISKLTSSAKNTNTELDKAFTPIRQLEKSIKSLRAEIPSKIATFKSFEKDLQNLETQYNKDNDTLKKAEKELGITIPRPKIFNSIVKALEKYQKEEEIFRKEINEFNKLSSTIKKIKI